MATFNEQANSILSQVLPILAADRTRRKDLEVRKEAADYNNLLRKKNTDYDNALAMNRLFMQAGVGNKEDYVKRQDDLFKLQEQRTKAQIESSRSKTLAQTDIPSMIKHLEEAGAFNRLLNNSDFIDWRQDPERWLDASENNTNMAKKKVYEQHLYDYINKFTGFSYDKDDAESLAALVLQERFHPDSRFDEQTEAVLAGVDPDMQMEALRYLKEQGMN